jgi:hypothetical protein
LTREPLAQRNDDSLRNRFTSLPGKLPSKPVGLRIFDAQRHAPQFIDFYLSVNTSNSLVAVVSFDKPWFSLWKTPAADNRRSLPVI